MVYERGYGAALSLFLGENDTRGLWSAPEEMTQVASHSEHVWLLQECDRIRIQIKR